MELCLKAKKLCWSISAITAVFLSPLSQAPAQTGEHRRSAPSQDGGWLEEDSPWPKFRRDLRQTGRSEVVPVLGAGKIWSFPTGKGIFSSPIVTASGSIIIGSADHHLYALSSDGRLQWKFKADEIIDSAALVDRDHRLYFAAGDGYLRALDADGKLLWDYLADDPKDTGAYIRWFEGNVAINIDGTLLAPNDNFSLYAVDRDSGQQKWRFPLNDQSWSSPAVDPETGHLYFGSNYIAPFTAVGRFYRNLFALTSTGDILWRTSIPASISASPLLSRHDLVVVGGFDGMLRAFDKTTGAQRWQFATLDHIYSSPAELSTGTIIQASTDGNIYAIDGQNGKLLWSHALGDPLRSSPAVDGLDNIYIGGGDGALYVLDRHGKLLYRLQLIDSDRNDLNASPALGKDSVYLAGENGEVWSVPLSYCLSNDGKRDRRCSFTARETPALGLGFVSDFGSYTKHPPSTIGSGDIIGLRLMQAIPEDGNWKLLAEEGIEVVTDPPNRFDVQLASDRRTLLLIPRDFWTGLRDTLALRVKIPYLHQLKRQGLKWEGGSKAGELVGAWQLKLGRQSASALQDRYYLSRLAVPLPTIMPSYNQIGFDSLSFIMRVLEQSEKTALAFMLPAKTDDSGQLQVDTASGQGFPLSLNKAADGWVLNNQQGFRATALNFTIPFEEFRLSVHSPDLAQAYASTRCGKVPTYGYFLRKLGFCSPTQDRISVLAAANFGPLATDREEPSIDVGFAAKKLHWGRLQVNLKFPQAIAPGQPLSLVLFDRLTLEPITYDPNNLSVQTNAQGLITAMELLIGTPKVKHLGVKLLLGEDVVFGADLPD